MLDIFWVRLQPCWIILELCGMLLRLIKFHDAFHMDSEVFYSSSQNKFHLPESSHEPLLMPSVSAPMLQDHDHDLLLYSCVAWGVGVPGRETEHSAPDCGVGVGVPGWDNKHSAPTMAILENCAVFVSSTHAHTHTKF